MKMDKMAEITDERIDEIIKHIIRNEIDEDDKVDIITVLAKSKQQFIHIYPYTETPILYREPYKEPDLYYSDVKKDSIKDTEILSSR